MRHLAGPYPVQQGPIHPHGRRECVHDSRQDSRELDWLVGYISRTPCKVSDDLKQGAVEPKLSLRNAAAGG